MCLLDFCYLLCSYFFESCVFLGESRWQREDFRCTKFTVPERFSVPVPCWKVIGSISTVVNDLFSIKHTSYKWYPVVLSYKEYFCHKVESASFYVPFIYLGKKKSFIDISCLFLCREWDVAKMAAQIARNIASYFYNDIKNDWIVYNVDHRVGTIKPGHKDACGTGHFI